jgi:hypothetical protein
MIMKHGYSVGSNKESRLTAIEIAIRESSIELVKSHLIELKRYIPVICSEINICTPVTFIMNIIQDDIDHLDTLLLQYKSEVNTDNDAYDNGWIVPKTVVLKKDHEDADIQEELIVWNST